VVTRRQLIVAGWLAAGALLFPASRRVERTLDVSARIEGSESAGVDDALRQRFASPFSTWALLVVTGIPAGGRAGGDSLLRDVIDAVQRVPGVTRTLSRLDTPDTTLAGRGDDTFVVVGLEPGGRPPDTLMPPLRAATEAFAQEHHQAAPNLALRWTGEVALNFDLRRTSARDANAAEARALPLTLALLLWAFGAVAAALLAVFAGISAIGVTLGIVVMLSPFLHLSILLVNIVSMLGLGLGIDYALLMISRFRESMASGANAKQAAEVARREAGHTIALSGLAVAIGFAALFAVPLNELRSVSVGGLLVAALSVLLATTLLPIVLSWLGLRIDAGRLRRRRRVAPDGRWLAWGAFVVRHPWRVLAIAGLPVLALAAQSRRLVTALPRGNWLPPTMESAQGIADLSALHRSAVVQTMRVIVELPPGEAPLGRAAWNAVRAIGDTFAADSAIAAVRSLPTLVGKPWNPIAIAFIPPAMLTASVSGDRRAVTFDVIPREGADAEELTRFVHRMRAVDVARLTGMSGLRMRVGGLPAFNADYEDAVNDRLPRIVALVVVGTLLALCVGFRSLLIPVKAVALNLLSVAGAFGALVLVFQDGHGVRWLGMSDGVHGIFPIVPALVFCTVFGLSMDYEVFLVARVAEGRRRGLSDDAALIEGLARTGGVITSAAAIMIGVFAAFALGEFVMMKMLGFALAVAVALDATVVRLAIGPALLCLAGEWNWWPGRVSRK
jgi:RND superfamily putative drug exporter